MGWRDCALFEDRLSWRGVEHDLLGFGGKLGEATANRVHIVETLLQFRFHHVLDEAAQASVQIGPEFWKGGETGHTVESIHRLDGIGVGSQVAVGTRIKSEVNTLLLLDIAGYKGDVLFAEDTHTNVQFVKTPPLTK